MFSKGDFVICIKNFDTRYVPPLTIWKKYEVHDVRYDGAITILDDKVRVGYYHPDRFISIEQAREDKLNIILKEAGGL
jgi:hypothetical protein